MAVHQQRSWSECCAAVRPASVSRQACGLAAVTVAAEIACAASCKAQTKASEGGKKANVSRQSGWKLPSRQIIGSNTL